jgi:branched-subunit amino acid aminotransferase/4-amino-4-deoxychorismate lyase
LNQQIEEVERELEYRAKVYATMQAKGTMKPSRAEYHTQRMEAVLQTLKWLRRHEEKIKELTTVVEVIVDGDDR